MTVREYLKFVAQVRKLKKDSISSRIKEVAGSCGLTEVLRKPIEELSKGYRQRLGLAQAIIHEPEVLILDEPTTGLDPNQIVEIRDLIKKIGREKTIIFSTHILSEVSAVCDRVIIINKGQIVGEGTPEEITNKVGSSESFYIKIKGDKDKILDKLKTVEEVKEVKVEDKESEGVYGYEVIPQKGSDAREKISSLIISEGWNILEFNKKQISLEDAFRSLTNK